MILDLPAWRSWVGLSQSELALLSGVATMTVSDLERGQAAPNASTIQRLAQAFGVPRAVLLHSTPEDEWARGWRPPEHDSLLERTLAQDAVNPIGASANSVSCQKQTSPEAFAASNSFRGCERGNISECQRTLIPPRGIVPRHTAARKVAPMDVQHKNSRRITAPTTSATPTRGASGSATTIGSIAQSAAPITTSGTSDGVKRARPNGWRTSVVAFTAARPFRSLNASARHSIAHNPASDADTPQDYAPRSAIRPNASARRADSFSIAATRTHGTARFAATKVIRIAPTSARNGCATTAVSAQAISGHMTRHAGPAGNAPSSSAVRRSRRRSNEQAPFRHRSSRILGPARGCRTSTALCG